MLHQPVAAQHAATHWLVLTVLLAGAFLPPVDFFIVNVTLPSIHLSLGASPAELQLVIGAYAAGYAVFLITGGRLGDLVGAAMVSAVLGCLIVPLSEGRDQGWPLWVFQVLATVPFLVAAFLRHEAQLGARGGMPIVDLSLFAIPSFRRGVLVATLFFFTTSFYFLFGLYQQEGRGLDPLHTGLAIAPYGVGLFLGPLVTSPLVRLRPGLLAIGMAIQVVGYAAVSGLVAWGTGQPSLVVAVFVAGFGQGIAFPRLYNTVLSDVPPHRAGLAAGIVNSALQVGASVSAAAIGSLFFGMLGPNPGERGYAHAFATAQITLTAALFAAMLIAIPAWRGTIRTPAKTEST